MKPSMKSKLIAGLMAGVTALAALPALAQAQNGPGPMMGQMQGQGPIGQGPMGQPGMMAQGQGMMGQPGMGQMGQGPMGQPGMMAQGQGMMGQPGQGPMMGGDDWPRFDLKNFDTDGDGKVTLAEIQGKRAAEAKSLDADGDGKISADELINADLARARTFIEARVKARIAAQDTDGDGLLSAAELAAPVAPVGLFERLDTDNDGALSEAELAAVQNRMMRFGGDRMRGQMMRGGHRDGHHGFGQQQGYGGMMGQAPMGRPMMGQGPANN